MHDDFFRITELAPPSPPLCLPALPAGHRWSKAIWATQKDDWVALFRPLNLALLYLHRSLLAGQDGSNQATWSEELCTGLRRERFLLAESEEGDEREPAELIRQAQSGVFRFICILPTTACELKCTYCHQLVKPGQEQFMTREEIQRGLSLCAELCTDLTKPVDILIYGGEPLKAFDICAEIFRLAHPAAGLFRQQVRLSFTTSGVGLTDDQAALLARHDVFVIVSIDARPEENDLVRISLQGSSAYAAAERACRMFKDRGCRLGLSITIGKHNADHLAQQVEMLLEKFQPNDIGLNAFLHRRGESINPFQLDGISAFRAVLEGFQAARRYGVFPEQPMRRLRPFVFRQPLLKDCSAGGERLVLAPGGQIGFCDSCFPDKRFFYPLDHLPVTDDPDYLQWAALSSPEMPTCRECPAMTVCGGACRYDAFKASGKLDGVDPLRCQFELAFLRWMIWDLFDRRESNQERFYFPNIEQRESLIKDISLHEKNQPFTAGSYLNRTSG